MNMRNPRSLNLFLSVVAGLSAVAVSACSGSGPGAAGSEETSTTQSQALAAGGKAVDYRHVKGVKQVPAKPGAPPTDAQCRAAGGSPCYSPQEMQVAYGVAPLIAEGFDGKG